MCSADFVNFKKSYRNVLIIPFFSASALLGLTLFDFVTIEALLAFSFTAVLFLLAAYVVISIEAKRDLSMVEVWGALRASVIAMSLFFCVCLINISNASSFSLFYSGVLMAGAVLTGATYVFTLAQYTSISQSIKLLKIELSNTLHKDKTSTAEVSSILKKLDHLGTPMSEVVKLVLSDSSDSNLSKDDLTKTLSNFYSGVSFLG